MEVTKQNWRELLEKMTPDQLHELWEETEAMGPVVTFPWHDQQQKALDVAPNNLIIIGGNQSGKTTVGRGIVSRVVNREGPVYDRLRNPQRALKIWVSPLTLEKFTSNWEKQLIEEVFSHFGQRGVDWKYISSPIPKFTWVDEYTTWDRPNELWGKSTDQGYMSFESDVVDLIVFDEEPEDRRIYVSSIVRTSTTNGIICFTFTPLRGLSWTHAEFYIPVVNPKNPEKNKVSDRMWRLGNHAVVIQMGMADNPEAVRGGGVARIQNNPSMKVAEKNTRLYGTYGFTEGLIWTQVTGINAHEDSPYFIDSLPKGPLYNWTLTLDPNKRHGGLLGATDEYGNTFVVAEHYLEDVPDRVHAAAFHTMISRWEKTGQRAKSPRHGLRMVDIDVWADPGGAGAQHIINLSDYNIFAAAVKKGAGSVKASIQLVRRALHIDPMHRHPVTGKLGAPHLYFLRSLSSKWMAGATAFEESRLFWELRVYRQREGAEVDTPIKKNDDVVDPLRYLFLARQDAPVAEIPDTDAQELKKLNSVSRRAAMEWDELIQRKGRYAKKAYIDETLGRM